MFTKLKCCFPVWESEEATPSKKQHRRTDSINKPDLNKKPKQKNLQSEEVGVSITRSGTPWSEGWSVASALVSGAKRCRLCLRLCIGSGLNKANEKLISSQLYLGSDRNLSFCAGAVCHSDLFLTKLFLFTGCSTYWLLAFKQLLQVLKNCWISSIFSLRRLHMLNMPGSKWKFLFCLPHEIGKVQTRVSVLFNEQRSFTHVYQSYCSSSSQTFNVMHVWNEHCKRLLRRAYTYQRGTYSISLLRFNLQQALLVFKLINSW